MFTRGSFLRMLGPRDWVALFAVWRSLLLATALDPLARNLALEGETLADFLRGWSPRLQALFVGLARSGLAIDADKITMASFIACLRFYTLLQRDALRFTYFLTDCGTALITPLVDVLAARAGELLLGVTATRLGLGGAGERQWRVTGDTRLGPRAFYADHVILAVDAPAAQRLLCASPATSPVAQTLRWPAGLPDGVARLWFDAQPRPGPEGGIFTGDFIVDNFFWLHRIQPECAAWAKATGGSLIEMHVYRSPEFLAQPDALLLARAITDVYRAFPELRGHVIHETFQRNAATQTSLSVDRPDRWLGVQTPWPNLWACGDWVRGEWPALNMERACVSGLTAANGVLESMGLEPFPIAPYPKPEWLAGKIQGWLLGGREWLRRWVAG
jgi:isorenieratene synthase